MMARVCDRPALGKDRTLALARIPSPGLSSTGNRLNCSGVEGWSSDADRALAVAVSLGILRFLRRDDPVADAGLPSAVYFACTSVLAFQPIEHFWGILESGTCREAAG